jgi:hypothetical protein
MKAMCLLHSCYWNGGEIKIYPDLIEVCDIYGMNAKNQREVLKITQDNAKMFLDKWKEYHGNS